MFTEDGLEVPVLDITHPSFAILQTDSEIARMEADFVAKRQRAARWWSIERLVMPLLMRRSVLGRHFLGVKQTGFLPGTPTYLMKLGPDHLGPWAGTIDRQFAAAFPFLALRIRVRDMARSLAAGLEPLLDDPARPIRIVDIAGGPCPDAINASILLADAGLLGGRSFRIQVLDPDTAGPALARRSLEALTSPGGRLAGIDATITHVPYDWTAPARLAPILADLTGEAVAVTSEGGLFEYGADDVIHENLATLAELLPEGAFVVGTFTRDSPFRHVTRQVSTTPTIPRPWPAIEGIVARAGWRIADRVDNPLSHTVRLVR